MSSITNASLGKVGPNPVPLRDVGNEAKTPETGNGLAGAAGPVPEIRRGEHPAGQVSANARASLAVFMSGGASVDTAVLLVQVAVAMRDTEASGQKAKINTDQEAKKAQAKEKEGKLEEAQKKMDEAAAKKKESSLVDKIKLAFEWLGAIIAVATAAILIATGVGAAVGVALMAAAVVAIVMAIDSTISLTTGMGIAGHASVAADKAANARGDNAPPLTDDQMKERAGKADMGFKIALAVVGVALAIASGGSSMVNGVKSFAQAGMSAARAGASAAEAAETGASVGKAIKDVAMAVKTAYGGVMKAAKEVEDAAETGVKVSKAVAKMADLSGRSAEEVAHGVKTAGVATRVADATQQIGAAGVDGANMGLKYQATEATADARKLEASAKVDQAVMQMLDDMIDQALSRLMASSDRFSAMLDAITDSMQDRGNTLSRAQFKG